MPTADAKRIAIVTFNQGVVQHGFAAALAQTMRARPSAVWFHMPTYDKNVLIPMIDRSDVDIVVWINSNIVWNETALEAVLSPIELGATFAAGCVYHRTREDGGILPVKLEFYSEDLDPLRGYIGPTRESGRFMYLRARRMPFGFLAVDRNKFIMAASEAARYKLHDEAERETRRLFEARVEKDALVDEDHTACDYLREEGVEIWVCMDEAVLQVVGGRAIGNPNQPPRIHEYAADCAKAKVKK